MAYRPPGAASSVSIVVLLVLTGCAPKAPPLHRRAQYTQYQRSEGAEDDASIASNCPAGKPHTLASWEHGPTRLVGHDGYALQHSSVDKIPLWVCEHVTASQLGGNLERTNPFAPDPKLEGFARAELADYKGSGYDRGHQAPAGDQTRDERLKDETFYLSNMAPQVGAFNQQVWAALEDEVRTWVPARGDVFIITGPMFYDPKEEDPATADGTIPYFTIGSGVAVPTHFYKIVAARGGGDWQVIGFVLENHKYPKPYDFSEYIRSVDWIEERTGIDFMPELDDESIEATPAALWH